MRGLYLVLWLLTALPAWAAPSRWVEVTGYALMDGGDADAARRRAMADALLAAALAGGADVRAHTAVDRAVVTSDLLIVRPVGRVLEHRVLSSRQNGTQWEVTLRARVGTGADNACQTRRRLIVTAYAPKIRVAPDVPAWAEPMAQEIVADLLQTLADHPATASLRVTRRAMTNLSAGQEALDYATLTRGSVRLGENEHAFLPALRLEVVGGAPGAKNLMLTLDLAFQGAQGEAMTTRVERHVTLPGPSPLGRAAPLLAPTRAAMRARLTAGLDRDLSAMLDREACRPVVAVLALRNGRITAPFGSANGLSRGAVAFTVDRDASTELLEVVALSPGRVELRPLDPHRPAAAFANRPVRFLDTGM